VSAFYIISDETTSDDVAVLAMGGEIDFAASPQLRDRLFGHIKSGRHRLVLDLSDATFIDSTAIGVVVGALTRLREVGGGTLAVVCPDGDERVSIRYPETPTVGNRVRQVFVITGLDAGVRLCRSREEALMECALAA
jgi:anti-sigma B factor antagonist